MITLEGDRAYSAGVDIAASELEALPRTLRALNLNSAAVTDALLETISTGFAALEDLDISGSAVTDHGVVHLAKLTRLRHLRIKETKLTDRGVARLAHCRALETLNLKGLPLTGQALRYLAHLPCLERAVFSGVTLDAEAMATFRVALPACEVILDGRVIG